MTDRIRRPFLLLLLALTVAFVDSPARAQEGYVLDGFGGVHAVNGASVISPATPYFGFDIARDISLVPEASSGSGMVIASPGSFANVNGGATQYQSLFGTSFSGTAIGGGVLFPVACTAGGLVVTTNTATATRAPRPMVGTETATMTVMVNETDTALSCTLTAGQSQCTDTDSVSISVGDRVGYKITYANLNTSANGTFYFHKGFTCS